MIDSRFLDGDLALEPGSSHQGTIEAIRINPESLRNTTVMKGFGDAFTDARTRASSTSELKHQDLNQQPKETGNSV